MRKSALFLFLFVLFSSLGAAEDGFSLYLNKNYKEAYIAFNEQFISSSGDPLYAYNLGVTATAMGQKGSAVYFYIQALQRAPELPEAKNNLKILAGEMNITIPQVLLEPVHSVDYLLIIFLISIYLFSILVSVLCFRNDWRIKTALLPVFLVMTVSAAMYFINYEEENRINWAVAVSGDSLRSGPDSSLTEIGKIREGEIINVVSSSGSWYKVKSFQDNVEGWIELKSIRAVMRGHI